MPRTSKTSSLPEFRVVEPSVLSERNRRPDLWELAGLTAVTCVRTGCGETFYVNLEGWHRNKLPTRPCPYCFKASIVPGRDPSVSNHLGAR